MQAKVINMATHLKKKRFEEIRRIWSEARKAARQGRSRDECPYKYMDAYQWRRAYDDEMLTIRGEEYP